MGLQSCLRLAAISLLLGELDRELERRGLRFVRYADDCNIIVRSRRSGERVLDSIECFLKRRLRLVVNRDPSNGSLQSEPPRIRTLPRTAEIKPVLDWARREL